MPHYNRWVAGGIATALLGMGLIRDACVSGSDRMIDTLQNQARQLCFGAVYSDQPRALAYSEGIRALDAKIKREKLAEGKNFYPLGLIGMGLLACGGALAFGGMIRQYHYDCNSPHYREGSSGFP